MSSSLKDNFSTDSFFSVFLFNTALQRLSREMDERCAELVKPITETKMAVQKTAQAAENIAGFIARSAQVNRLDTMSSRVWTANCRRTVCNYQSSCHAMNGFLISFETTILIIVKKSIVFPFLSPVPRLSFLQFRQDRVFGLRDNWDWVLKLVRCVDVHAKNSSDYHQVRPGRLWSGLNMIYRLAKHSTTL